MARNFRILAVASFALLAAPLAAAPREIAGLDDKVSVVTDRDGIPHISAENEHDLIFMQGWVHARDRLFQMDVLRRQASGTLAELLGSGALKSDVELRTIGLRRAAERSVPVLSAETQAALAAYAAGVNAFVAAHPLPPEYAALRLAAVDDWTPVDSVVIAKLLAFSLSFDLDIADTVALLSYQAAGQGGNFNGAALYFQDLFRSAPFDAAATVPDAMREPPANGRDDDEDKASKRNDGDSSATLELGRRYIERAGKVPLLRDALEPHKRRKGSNEWVIGGALTENGKPLIANDPHLALGIPATFYQIHLRAEEPKFDVIGSGLAGTPYVTLGQNRHIAWGATNNPMDVTDTFREQVVPCATSFAGLCTVYLGQPEPTVPIPQQFRYNDFAGGLATATPGTVVGGVFIPPAVLIVPRRNQGPIIQLDMATGAALSVQYTGFSGTREVDAIRRFNLARDLDDFVDGLRFFDVGSQNWAYADVRGNIAYFTSAEMPLREDLEAGQVVGLPPYFIRNGSGGNEWLADPGRQAGQAVPYKILPFAEMPQLVNPPAGYFINANNDPTGNTHDNNPLNRLRPNGVGIFYLNATYDFGTRAARIAHLLEERFAAGERVSVKDMKAIQADVVLRDAQVFTPHIARAFANARALGANQALAALAQDPRVAEAVQRLAGWDHSTPTGVAEGYDASDKNGVRRPPTAEEIDHSVGATIYTVWRGRMIANTVDAVVDFIAARLPPGTVPAGVSLRPGDEQALTALRHLLDNFATAQGVGASGLNFFNVPGVVPAAARRDIIILNSLKETLDRLAGEAFADAFDYSARQDDYRWGRLHRLVLAHPLDGPFSVPPAGGAFPPSFADLPGLAVDGGFGVVDASEHPVRAAGSHDFMFVSGPVQRYVAELDDGRIAGQTSLPGGESGVLGSPFHVNLLGRWLTNETHDMRQRPRDFRDDAFKVEHFRPPRASTIAARGDD